KSWGMQGHTERRHGVAKSQPAALRTSRGLWHDQHHARALLRSSHSASVPGPISSSMFSLHAVVMPAITMVDKPLLCAYYATLRASQRRWTPSTDDAGNWTCRPPCEQRACWHVSRI